MVVSDGVRILLGHAAGNGWGRFPVVCVRGLEQFCEMEHSNLNIPYTLVA